MKKPQLSILMVNWNTREMTLACLDSIYQNTKIISFEIILVDNGSNDNSADAISERFPDITLIRSTENLGFAAATNLAAKQAAGDYLLLLNTDTVVKDKAIERLCSFAAENRDAGIWGGRTIFADGSLNPTSCWRRPTFWSIFCITFGLAKLFHRSEFFNPEAYGDWKRDTIRQVDVISGCFFLTTQEIWMKLDGLHPDFFMYGEEADLCARAFKIGTRPLFTPETTIVHYGGASSQLNSDKAIYVFGARIGLVQRHLSAVPGYLSRKLIILAVFLRFFASGIIQTMLPSRRENFEHWARVYRKRNLWRFGPLKNRL